MASSDGSYEVLVWEDVITPARDGVALSNDVYFPARNSTAVADPLPVLLERTPYGKREAERAERARYFTRHGYVVVIQDCRGCFDSEGDLYFLRDEAADGYDTVEWIAAQPWCNGKVGTFGTSYAGWTQTSTAALNPPHLACQIPTMAGWNAHTSTVRQGGAFELRFMAWAFWHSAVNPNKRLKANPGAKETLDHTDFRDWLSQLPLKEGLSPLAQIPNYERWLMDIYTKADYDDFWRQPGFGVEEYLEQYSDVPTYFVGPGTTPTPSPPRTASRPSPPTRRGPSTPSWALGPTAPTPLNSATPATWISAPAPPWKASTTSISAGSTAGSRKAHHSLPVLQTANLLSPSSSWVVAPAASSHQGVWTTAVAGVMPRSGPCRPLDKPPTSFKLTEA